MFYHNTFAQYQWNWKDPVDFNVIDLGDNKVLLYNGLAAGLVHFLSMNRDDNGHSEKFSSLTGEYIREYRKAPLSTIYNVKYRSGWKWKKPIWIGYEVGIQSIVNDSFIIGLGASPFFTWHIFNKRKWRLSYDNGVGPVYYSSNFPVEGTRFNFYTFYGLEVSLTTVIMAYTLGVRNTHISNAGISGKDRNPGFDGIGFYFATKF